ncbi:MAG: 2-dehydropantoate 2-reductase [Planctomycetota bacterium]|nr:2-dehydropantoate 2-reductase [Planctomycetota bacterium]
MSVDPQPRWCIAGNGAIGMSLAHRLQQQSVPVTLLTRDDLGARLSLTYQPIEGDPVEWTCEARSTPDGRPIDHLVIATKSAAVPEVLDTWSDSLAPCAVVYLLQNGIRFDAPPLPASTHALHVVNGGFTAYLAAPDHVVQSAMKPIWIGDEAGDPMPPELKRPLDLLNASGFRAQWTRSIMRLRWRKAAVNTVLNTQAVVYDCDNGSLLSHPPAIKDTRLMCEELGAVFESSGIDLTGDQLLEATREVMESTARNICSTLQDHRSGLTTHELDHITLPLLERARRQAVPTPRCEALYAEVTRRFGDNAHRSTTR